MDVSTISNAAAQFSATNINRNAAAAYSAGAKTANNTEEATSSIGNAFEVDISDEAKAAAAQQTDATEETNTSKSKGLTTEQVNYLKETQAMQEQSMLNLMIQVLQGSNDKLQGWLDDGTGILNFGGIQVDASRFALPAVATNAEDAAAAVAEGGDWSVSAVSDRIFSLAETLAGGDPDKLEEMRAAVEEGFRQAGLAWGNVTGSTQMPDITQQTYQELMHRFDTSMKQLTGQA